MIRIGKIVDKEFKELRDKIGKIWEVELPVHPVKTEEQLKDTEIIIHNSPAFKFFQTYGYFNMSDDVDIVELFEFIADHQRTLFYPHIKLFDDEMSNFITRPGYERSLIIDLAKLDAILSIISKRSDLAEPDEPEDDDDDMVADMIDYEVQTKYFPKFIDDLKKVVALIGGPQKFKNFYDDMNREANG